MASSNFHVAIVGAGLGGLCLAQALHRAGVAFDVYERDPSASSRTQGYRIRIDAQGQHALRQCLPPELFLLFQQSCAQAISAGQLIDTQLQDTRGRPAQTWAASAHAGQQEGKDREGELGDLSAHRQRLREILLRGIEPHVHYGKSLEHYTQINGGVRATFADGTICSTQLLVGADGVHSAVRRQLAPRAAPCDTGAVCIYGRAADSVWLRQALDARLWSGTSVVFADGFAGILDAMRFADVAALSTPPLNSVDDYLYWALIGPREHLGLPADASLTGPALAARVQSITQDWAPGLKAVFEHSPHDAMAMLPVRSSRPQAAWRSGPVTLLGDAVHVMSPAGGVGANTALQDAAELAAQLLDWLDARSWAGSAESPLSDAITAYETTMLARAISAVKASEDAAQRLFLRTAVF